MTLQTTHTPHVIPNRSQKRNTSARNRSKFDAKQSLREYDGMEVAHPVTCSGGASLFCRLRTD
jgi:hypothetical protein